MPHGAGQVALRSLEQQMVMVGHQAIGRDAQAKHLRRAFEQADEGLEVLGVAKDDFPPPAAVHDMVPSAGEFESKWS